MKTVKKMVDYDVISQALKECETRQQLQDLLHTMYHEEIKELDEIVKDATKRVALKC
jgi:hypothetical protein